MLSVSIKKSIDSYQLDFIVLYIHSGEICHIFVYSSLTMISSLTNHNLFRVSVSFEKCWNLLNCFKTNNNIQIFSCIAHFDFSPIAYQRNHQNTVKIWFLPTFFHSMCLTNSSCLAGWCMLYALTKFRCLILRPHKQVYISVKEWPNVSLKSYIC